MTTVRTLNKAPAPSAPTTVVPLADIRITWFSDDTPAAEPRTISGAELAPILTWLYRECGGSWDHLVNDSDLPEELMRLCNLLANFSTAEVSNDDGADLYGLAQAMTSLVNRLAVHPPRRASVTMTRGEETKPRVHPPLGEPVTHGKRVSDCPVCGAAILGGSGEDLQCDRCEVRMHGECYWGRVAPLAEWQAFVRHVNGGPDVYEGPPTVCAQCRAKGPA